MIKAFILVGMLISAAFFIVVFTFICNKTREKYENAPDSSVKPIGRAQQTFVLTAFVIMEIVAMVFVYFYIDI